MEEDIGNLLDYANDAEDCLDVTYEIMFGIIIFIYVTLSYLTSLLSLMFLSLCKYF